jgi:hypothetical protein
MQMGGSGMMMPSARAGVGMRDKPARIKITSAILIFMAASWGLKVPGRKLKVEDEWFIMYACSLDGSRAGKVPVV